MASRIKARKQAKQKHGASLPPPPKCRRGMEPVWVKKEKKKEDKLNPKVRNKKEPIGGGGKWVCKTKSKPKDPNKPTPPKPHPNPNVGPKVPDQPRYPKDTGK